jgi:cellulose synthase/poly-beta-1,6-N-acetylglucosamine synthase-like glycosyltransferase/GGDEF domain-containing protein
MKSQQFLNPFENLPYDRKIGLQTERLFIEEIKLEMTRTAQSSVSGCLAYLHLDELPYLRDHRGTEVEKEISKQITALLLDQARPFDLIGRDKEGHFTLLLPQTDTHTAQRQLKIISDHIVQHLFMVNGEPIRLTPAIGFVPFSAVTTLDQLREYALAALYEAVTRLDLQPVCYHTSMATTWKQVVVQAKQQARWQVRLSQYLRSMSQITLVHIVAFGTPFILYTTSVTAGMDITPVVYIVVVLALLITAYFIWLEGFFALRPLVPPREPATAYPPASAIIAAYLPNEASTIIETVKAFLRISYPAPFQVILAYNTPRELPVERLLQEIARRDPRFLPLRVRHSTSKAQNVNAALAHVCGEFVGIFDADHHPEPDSYTRAWRWLSNGYDVVQGHCVIRNGNESWVARLVTVEFEAIYAVSHLGRNRLHDFGLFGGSNGYWKTNLLRQTLMRDFMLTEDIDASMRVVKAGYKIASDPWLLSRELAPATLKALWNQRMRWAQGWFQVSLKHLWSGLRSPKLSLRQKLGLLHLLGWREVYPWISVQMVPLLAFWTWRYGGVQHLHWFIPICVLTTLFTLSTGPGQTVFAYLLAVPEIRNHKGWFLFYLFISSFFYTGLKNLIAVVAQIKEFMRERDWKVTPRSTLTKDI